MPSPAASGRSPDPRALRSRAAALAAARDLLVDQGLQGVTHVAVAARSGIGRTTLYRHWPDAAALLQDALSELVADAEPPTTGDLRSDLVALLEGSRRLLHQPVSERAMRALVERSGVDAAFTSLKQRMYDTGTAACQRILRGAVDRGDLPADLDFELAVAQLVGPLFFRRLMGDLEVTSAFVHQVVDSFLRTYARAPHPRSSAGDRSARPVR
ncbi:TetR/AcrR family transcriptional regulator C-terminal ligand-binding domain-containing protein [Yinghuangia sp. YIM S09857]|uniref:TetR/AcrR family transcriptional regulator n=1 Tax=Yinghuangia sp. YIM S09857 TaxID=3436929 RepID=UPI003F53C6B0